MSNTHFSWLKSFIDFFHKIKLHIPFCLKHFFFFCLTLNCCFDILFIALPLSTLFKCGSIFFLSWAPPPLKIKGSQQRLLFNFLCNHHRSSHTYLGKMGWKCGRNTESSCILSWTAPSIWDVPMVSLMDGWVLLGVYTGYPQLFPTIP